MKAQAQASATCTVTIVSPITIQKEDDMNFGNVSVNNSAGTVTLSPLGNRIVNGGVTLPNSTGPVMAASFQVNGMAHYTYDITLPGSDLTLASGSNTMTMNAFTSFPATGGMLDNTGKQVLNVGATLFVTGNQAPGLYISVSPFTVNVNYN